MLPQGAEARLIEILGPDAVGPELRPGAAFEAMLRFYAEERAEGCSLDDNGDMLFFQWGERDGSRFASELARQFMTGSGEEGDILQLRLTFTYAGDPALTAVGEGEMWCAGPDEVDWLREFINGSEALRAAEGITPVEVAVHTDVL